MHLVSKDLVLLFALLLLGRPLETRPGQVLSPEVAESLELCEAAVPTADTRQKHGCYRLQRRLGSSSGLAARNVNPDPEPGPGQAAGQWRAAMAEKLSRFSWGMPGCPVESKELARGRGCNNSRAVLEAFSTRPLVLHVLDDALSWIHFAEPAVRRCRHPCVWAGQVHASAGV